MSAYLPSSQVVQLPAPGEAAYVPLLHPLHDPAPLGANVPSVHVVQDELAVLAYLPAWHVSQLVASMEEENLPASHG
jgi:hypothetical protein